MRIEKKKRKTTPWPIVRSCNSETDQETYEKLSSIARDYRNLEPAISRQDLFGPLVNPGWESGPTIYFEDHRVVDLIPESSAQSYEYRMLGLAGDEDFFLTSLRRDRNFEQSLSDSGLGRPNIIRLNRKDDETLAQTAYNNSALIERLAEAAKIAGVINIVPYQSSPDVWHLAKTIADKSQTPVKVAGSLPVMTLCANDKIWFAGLVRRIHGDRAIPVTQGLTSKAAVMQNVLDLAQNHKHLVLKLPASAGGMGNIRLSSEIIQNISKDALYSYISDLLGLKDWHTGEPLLVGVWDSHVIDSPSVQIWVPKLEFGLPVIEGVFEQIVAGEQGTFVGARRAQYSLELTKKICREAFDISFCLQQMGYYGRLSLDTVLIQRDDLPPIIHWIEANARWGGVSIPMTVANRFQSEYPSHSPYVFQRYLNEETELDIEKILNDNGLQTLSSDGDKGYIYLLPKSGNVKLVTLVGLSAKKINAIQKEINANLN